MNNGRSVVRSCSLSRHVVTMEHVATGILPVKR
jgi:hypothetical protein